ncbi:transcriptional regulator, LuxR family [Catenulispora acidiphila DSM 44928]|uniref:Transcriptional regulator, LuxR family n=1 Tax=Catenulispora acidiphila (strain DSM 44928 / JCM 14897 / NBRC 102108 / NRRL B-24433 / ID139908) TaxID=479433 RepID=C7QDL5_CATAD|nr:LuxR family transcriptional regulator [Catenulispora acidiphila]ACU74639.1 transcriptional regulator, LuxR family [Catenulispora acidiphila DSM 44928]
MVDTLIGREWHLNVLRASVERLRTGSGAAVALAGEPGIGKSALLWAAGNAARAAGVAVVAVRGADLAQSPDVHAACAHVVDAVGAHAAAGRPVVVTVDDIHLLGTDEPGLVGRLLGSTAHGPVLCVLAYRRRQLAPRPAATLADASTGLLRLAPLDPLTREQATELLGEHPDADEIHRQAAGNPQYIKVLSALRDTGATAEAGASIFGELTGLEPEALAAIRAAAVLGEPFGVPLLADIAALDEPAAVRALDQLTGVDLIRPAEHGSQLALRHRAVGEAVYERLEPSLRFALHRRAADALAATGAPVAHRARHVTRAADAQNPEHLTTLIAAARAVIYASPATAAEYLQSALPLLRGEHGHAHEVHVLLARARLLSGEFTEGRALLDALSSAGPEQPDGAALDSTRIERRLGRPFEAGALARSGLAALAETDSATAAALHAELADTAYDVQDYETSRMHAETAAAIAARHGDRVGEAHALAQSALGHLFTSDEATALARAARAAELIDATPDTMLLTNLAAPLQLGMTEGLLGRLTDSERHLARAEVLSWRTGQTHLDGELLTVLANAQCRLGKLGTALGTLERVARRHEGIGEHGGNALEAGVAANLRAAALHWRDEPGDAEQVRVALDRALAIANDSSTSWAIAVRCFHAELVLFTGDPVRARSLLLEVAGEDLSGISPWRRPRWCDTLAEAALAVGDGAEADHWAAVAERAPQQPSTLRPFALRAGMWAHAALGEHEAALTRAQESVREFTARGERIEVCRTLLAASEFALRAGRADLVAGWLDRVALLAEQCGAGRLATEAVRHRSRLAALADAQPDPQSTSAPLTAREREIANLVSTGMTNTAIAEKLFLSVRTVESHLRQIYRKLDVPNRAALTRALLDARRASRPPTP